MKIGQGKENARLFLKQNNKLLEEISKKIKETLKKEKEQALSSPVTNQTVAEPSTTKAKASK